MRFGILEMVARNIGGGIFINVSLIDGGGLRELASAMDDQGAGGPRSSTKLHGISLQSLIWSETIVKRLLKAQRW